MEGKDGLTYALCAGCEVTLREQEAEEEDGWEDDELECADCGVSLGPHRAPYRFVHLWKGSFQLCETCWCDADHEDDFLQNCNCRERVYWKDEDEAVSCYWCCRPVKTITHCECPVPSIDKETPNHCVFCKGAYLPKKDE
jgi:hypothetical protein